MHRHGFTQTVVVSSVLLAATGSAVQSIPLSPTAIASGAQITNTQGIEFVTIGAPGNAAWPGNGTPGDRTVGFGAVTYQYRMARDEVTTTQWCAFMNAAFDRPANDRLPFLIPPTTWGAVGTTPTVPGGRRWTVPAGNELRFVGNISWRMAAMYANWLCNDQSTARSAFLNGSYDVSSFGYLPNTSIFTDQITHNAGARFWIPTYDEWIKAAHFDPNRNGTGQGGYWLFDTTSDTHPIYGPPGQGQANAGFTLPGFAEDLIPLAAYGTTQSPWGLLDTSGANREWTEAFGGPAGITEFRLLDGSARGDSVGTANSSDWIIAGGGDSPSFSDGDYGFRIAGAVIPSPGFSSMGLMALAILARRRRRNGVTHAPTSDPPCRSP